VYFKKEQCCQGAKILAAEFKKGPYKNLYGQKKNWQPNLIQICYKRAEKYSLDKNLKYLHKSTLCLLISLIFFIPVAKKSKCVNDNNISIFFNKEFLCGAESFSPAADSCLFWPKSSVRRWQHRSE
jgi:hypothetical protein